jgi:hypothetical protein
MMKTLKRTVVVGALSAAIGLSIGCGGTNGGSGGSVTTTDDTVASSLQTSRRHRPSTIERLDAGAPAAPAAADPTPAGGNANAADVNAAIAAAQTADGQAIPQGAGPNGACPQVLVLLGFWSCPRLAETCSYTTGGVAHSCACDRTDGEGQTPSWVCDQ